MYLISFLKLEGVRVVDYSTYCPLKGNNGGMYYTGELYHRVDSDKFEIKYFTSSDFSYCNKLGEYQECSNCMYYEEEEDLCYKKYDVVSKRELLEKIGKAVADKYIEVTLYYEDGKEIIFPAYSSYCQECNRC